MEAIRYRLPKNLFQQIYKNSTCFLFVYILGIFISLSFIFFFLQSAELLRKGVKQLHLRRINIFLLFSVNKLQFLYFMPVSRKLRAMLTVKFPITI